jgi:hypothetical protein
MVALTPEPCRNNKSSPGTGTWNSPPRETDSLPTIGFRSGSTDANTTEIPHPVRLKPDRIAEVRELGIVRTIATYVRGDVFRIAIVAGGIRYYKNGRLLYVSGLTPAYPLLVSASLQDRGATLTNAIVAGKFTQVAARPATLTYRASLRADDPGRGTEPGADGASREKRTAR